MSGIQPVATFLPHCPSQHEHDDQQRQASEEKRTWRKHPRQQIQYWHSADIKCDLIPQAPVDAGNQGPGHRQCVDIGTTKAYKRQPLQKLAQEHCARLAQDAARQHEHGRKNHADDQCVQGGKPCEAGNVQRLPVDCWRHRFEREQKSRDHEEQRHGGLAQVVQHRTGAPFPAAGDEIAIGRKGVVHEDTNRQDSPESIQCPIASLGTGHLRCHERKSGQQVGHRQRRCIQTQCVTCGE